MCVCPSVCPSETNACPKGLAFLGPKGQEMLVKNNWMIFFYPNWKFFQLQEWKISWSQSSRMVRVFCFLLTRTTEVEHKSPDMCGQEYVWTDQHKDKMKCPMMKLRVLSTLLTSFIFSSMLRSLCLSLFDNFDIFLTDRQTNQPKKRS